MALPFQEDADDPDEIESKNYSEDHDESQVQYNFILSGIHLSEYRSSIKI